MRLLQATGMVKPPTAEDLEGAAWDRLLAEAVAFRRAGGVVSLGDWRDLEQCERDALVEAYRVVESERAAAFGMATWGPEHAAAVAGQGDGGEAQRGLAMDRALRAVVTRAQAGSAPAEGQP